MRVVVLTPYAGDLFGQERVLRETSRLMRAAGHSVYVIAEHVRGSTDFCDGLFQIKGTSSLNQLSTPSQLRKINGRIWQYLEEISPDVVHFIDEFDYRLTARISAKYPTLLSVHTVSPTCPASHRLINEGKVCEKTGGYGCLKHFSSYGCLDGFHGFLRKALVIDRFARLKKQYLKMDHVVAVSRYIRDILIENGWDEKRISVVYNPVEIGAITPHPSVPENLLLCVSRLQKLKGIHILLQALAMLKHREWTLWICGEGPEQESLQKQVAQLGLGERVKFVGKTPYEHTLQLMSGAKVFIQANLAPESFGLAAVEAAMLGVPVVSADVPALSEVLDSNSARFFPPGDVDALARCIEAALTESSDEKNKVTARLLQKKYAAAIHLQGMLAAYETAIRSFVPEALTERHARGLQNLPRDKSGKVSAR